MEEHGDAVLVSSRSCSIDFALEALRAERETATPPVDNTPGTTTPQNLEPDVPPEGLSHLGADGAYVYQAVDASAAWDAPVILHHNLLPDSIHIKREPTPMDGKQE